MSQSTGGGRTAAPALFTGVVLAAAFAAGCASDPALVQRIHDLDQVVAAQRATGEDLREQLAASEKALGAMRAENERLRGSDAAFRAAQAALEARIRELEGAFPDEPGGADVTVEKITGGYKFVVQGEVLFGLGEATLTDEGKTTLGRIAEALKGRKERIRVEGHTDNVPIVKAETKAKFPFGNLDLSLQRALHVADWLIREGGMAPSRVACAGYGEHAPRSDNGTPEGRRQNRRVEILVQDQ